MEGRFRTPPSTPIGVIRVRMKSEHPGTHDLRVDIFEVARGVAVIDAGGSLAAVVVQHRLKEGARGSVRGGQAPPVLAERVFRSLVRCRGEAVERDAEVYADPGHSRPPWKL